MTYTKKLIEVALPLEAINKEAAREKSIRHGHPSTLHIWWARRPLAACRAVLFASLVNDPSGLPDLFPKVEDQERERERLFGIIERLVKWENSNNEKVLSEAREEIARSTQGSPPSILDPFCGGGSIPLEAQRLGLQAYASDLNPVAVLMTEALIQTPPKFADQAPVNPEARSALNMGGWKGAKGLAADVRHYGNWMREEAYRRIGHLYPMARLPQGGEAPVIAWLWARTVKCPNPGCGAQMPLVRSFELSKKPTRTSSIEPIVDQAAKTVRFQVKAGQADIRPGTVGRAGADCIVCGTPVPLAYIRAEGRAGRIGQQLMAEVASSSGGRIFLNPDGEHQDTALQILAEDAPESELPERALSFRVQAYGMTRHRDLFTARQLVALTTFCDLVTDTRDMVLKDATAAGRADDGLSLDDGGVGASAYADAVATYLAMAVSRMTNTLCTLARWTASREQTVTAFARQAIPMTWDFPEVNPFAKAAGDLLVSAGSIAEVIEHLPARKSASVRQLDATASVNGVDAPVISTDPPYYDNIGYADLADFFYVWLRRALHHIKPHLFSTLLTPKEQELVATPYRFGGSREKANKFFEEGLRKTFESANSGHHPDYPMTLFYAFKQTESETSGAGDGLEAISSTGWETMLEGLLSSGFSITATWPLRSELGNRPVAVGTNALASSILLSCRPRSTEAPLATRKEFLGSLRAELPEALRILQHGNVAPVDLAQAAIGPGMGVFSRYSRVIEADGSPMRVRTALELINQVLTEVLSHQEDEFDSATRWAVSWFDQYAMREGPYGEADVLARAKGVAVNGLKQDGLIASGGGKVRLLKPNELPSHWDPVTDQRLRVWEVAHYLVNALNEGGEQEAAGILRKVGSSFGDLARDLAYRLFVTCDRKKWAQEALHYNQLVVAWPEIQRLATREETPSQQTLG